MTCIIYLHNHFHWLGEFCRSSNLMILSYYMRCIDHSRNESFRVFMLHQNLENDLQSRDQDKNNNIL